MSLSDDKIQNPVVREHIIFEGTRILDSRILSSHSQHIALVKIITRITSTVFDQRSKHYDFLLQGFTEKLMNGDVQSERKTWFFFGSQEQLNKLKHMSGFGPVASDSQVFFLNNFTN